MDVRVKAKEIDGELAVSNHEIILHLVQTAHSLGAWRSIIDVFFNVSVRWFRDLAFPTTIDRNEEGVASTVLQRIVRSVADAPQAAFMSDEFLA